MSCVDGSVSWSCKSNFHSTSLMVNYSILLIFLTWFWLFTRNLNLCFAWTLITESFLLKYLGNWHILTFRILILSLLNISWVSRFNAWWLIWIGVFVVWKISLTLLCLYTSYFCTPNRLRLCTNTCIPISILYNNTIVINVIALIHF